MNQRPAPKVEEISDSMTLTDLEEQLKLRLAMKKQLEIELPQHHKQIASVMKDLSLYNENNPGSEQFDPEKFKNEKGEIDPSKNYFVRMAFGSDLKNSDSYFEETPEAQQFWDKEYKAWLINHLRQFDARVEKWKAPESHKLQKGELDPADLDKVVETLNAEKSQLLKKYKDKIVESPTGEIKIAQGVKQSPALESVMSRLEALNNFVEKVKNDRQGECPLLGTYRANKSLRYARNMHDQLEILKTKLQPVGRQPLFTTGRNGINKMINLVDKKIPDSQRKPGEKKAAPTLMERLRLAR